MTEDQIAALTTEVAERFHSFGGGVGDPKNPISGVLINKPVMFALGVDIASVVRFVALKLEDRDLSTIDKSPTAMMFPSHDLVLRLRTALITSLACLDISPKTQIEAYLKDGDLE